MRNNIYSMSRRDEVLKMSPEELQELNQAGLDYLWEAMINGNTDFHTHSNVSDGKDSPAQLVQEIIKRDLDTFSLTDHDTMEGFKIISILYDKLNLVGMDLPDFIPGLEVNAEFEGQDIQILAYFPFGTFYLMEDSVKERQARRNERNAKIMQKIDESGLIISADELQNMGGGVIGRVHIANLIMRKGYVDSISEAFRLYLDKGQAFYVEKDLISIEETLKSIRDAGGIPVLSHPARYENWLHGDNVISKDELFAKIERLKNLGLQGLEVMHIETSFADSREFAHIGTELGLLPIAGSDYHGSHKANVPLRTQKDDPRKFLSLFYKEFRVSRL